MSGRTVLSEVGPDTEALRRAGPRRGAVRSRARRPAGRLLHPHRGSRAHRRPARACGPLAVRAGQSRDGADPRRQPASRVHHARGTRRGVPGDSAARAARRPKARTPTCCRSCSRIKRTHAATEPIPRGLVSCAHLYPAHPLRDAHGRARPFDAARYGAFQRLLSRYGDAEHVRMKRNVIKAVSAGAGPAGDRDADRSLCASVDPHRAAPAQGERRDIAGARRVVCGARQCCERSRGVGRPVRVTSRALAPWPRGRAAKIRDGTPGSRCWAQARNGVCFCCRMK